MSQSQAFTFMDGFVEQGNGASPEVFTQISEVRKVSFSGNKVSFADVTNISSPGNYAEKLPTIIEAGELAFDCNYIPSDTSQTSLFTTRDNRTKSNWKVILPGSLGHFSFQAYVASIDPSLDYSKEASLAVKLQITGPVTFTTP